MEKNYQNDPEKKKQPRSNIMGIVLLGSDWSHMYSIVGLCMLISHAQCCPIALSSDTGDSEWAGKTLSKLRESVHEAWTGAVTSMSTLPIVLMPS